MALELGLCKLVQGSFNQGMWMYVCICACMTLLAISLDIQPVHNYFKALTYMTTYFSKPESEVLESLKQAAKEIKN